MRPGMWMTHRGLALALYGHTGWGEGSDSLIQHLPLTTNEDLEVWLNSKGGAAGERRGVLAAPVCTFASPIVPR